jgi:hypothetical protein
MAATDWIRTGGRFVEAALREVDTLNPSGSVAVTNMWIGMEDSIKGVLVNGNVTWNNSSGHNLPYLINLAGENSLVTPGQVLELNTAAGVVTSSGTMTNFKYPERDPEFFETIPKVELQDRAGQAKKFHGICNSIVTGQSP